MAGKPPTSKPTIENSPSVRRLKKHLWLRLLVLLVVLLGVTTVIYWQWQRQAWRNHREHVLNLALVEENYLNAEPLLRELHQSVPNDIEILRALIHSQRRIGTAATEVEPLLTHWCRIDPNNPDAFIQRMQLWASMGQTEKQLADGQRAVRLQPDNLALREEVVALAIEAGDYNEAEVQAVYCVKAKPHDAYNQYLLARSYQLQGKDKNVDAVLQMLLQDHPDNVLGKMMQGVQQCRYKRFQQAIPPLRYALKSKLERSARLIALYHLGMALAQTKQANESKIVLQQWQQLHKADQLHLKSQVQPNNVELLVQSAQAWFIAGQDDRGAEKAHAILRLQPNHRVAHQMLADYYTRIGNRGRAAQHRHR